MDTPFIEAIISALSESVESICFAEVTVDTYVDEPRGEKIVSSLLIHSPIIGATTIHFPREIIEETSSIMLEIDESELTEENLQDTANEILNTVAGLALNKISNGEKEISIGIPSAIEKIETNKKIETKTIYINHKETIIEHQEI